MLVKTSLFRPLVPVDGSWSAWSGWGQCDSECSKIRSRTCTDPPPFGGGAPCPANETLITYPTISINPSSMLNVYGSSSPPSGSEIMYGSSYPQSGYGSMSSSSYPQSSSGIMSSISYPQSGSGTMSSSSYPQSGSGITMSSSSYPESGSGMMYSSSYPQSGSGIIIVTPSPSEMSGPPNMPQSNSTIHYNVAPCCGGDCPGTLFAAEAAQ